MAVASYWQRGEALDYKNNTDEIIEMGTVVDLTTRIGVVGAPIFPERTGIVNVEGVFAITKTDSSEEIAMGANVYFDGTGITASESGTLAGWAAADSASGDESIYVKIG